MSSRSALFAALCLVGLVGCGDKKENGPCTDKELMACGATCSASSSCPSGLYCEKGACTAECAPAIGYMCSTNETCSAEGRCNVKLGQGAGDGGTAGDAQAGGQDGGNGCAEVALVAEPETPNVIIIIDQSSSMDAEFGSGTRWTVLKQSLLADNGIIASLQDRVRFGVALYSSRNGNQGGMCPLISDTNLAIDNLPAIRALYQPADMIDDTPTGDAIEAVLTKVTSTSVDPDTKASPTIFILATDGEPDTCALPDSNGTDQGRAPSIAAVKKAFAAGIRTYVIAVANEQELSQKHVTDLANAGVGNTSSTPAPSYRPNNDQGLRDALLNIVTGVQSCDVPLKGKVTASACEATVKLGGNAVPCTGENGFELPNDSTLRLKGTACNELKAGKVLSAVFPCGGAIPLF